jgi:hypothetical protein
MSDERETTRHPSFENLKSTRPAGANNDRGVSVTFPLLTSYRCSIAASDGSGAI